MTILEISFAATCALHVRGVGLADARVALADDVQVRREAGEHCACLGVVLDDCTRIHVSIPEGV